MDNYTRKYFFDEIETILDSHPEKAALIFFGEDGLPVMLDISGGRAVGGFLGVLEIIFGYLGESTHCRSDAIDEIRVLIASLPSGIDRDADPDDTSPVDAFAHIGGLIWQICEEASS